MTSRKITYSSDAVNSERSRAGQEKYITSRKPKEMEMRDTHRLIEFVTALYRLAPGPLRFNHEDGQNLYVVREALRELQQCREENEGLRETLKIASGAIKEICQECGVSLPLSTLTRIDKALEPHD